MCFHFILEMYISNANRSQFKMETSHYFMLEMDTKGESMKVNWELRIQIRIKANN